MGGDRSTLQMQATNSLFQNPKPTEQNYPKELYKREKRESSQKDHDQEQRIQSLFIDFLQSKT